MRRAILPILSLCVMTMPLLAADDAPVRTIRSQPSWVLQTKQVDLAVTQVGGHMAPVTFFRDADQAVQPYTTSVPGRTKS